jgi:signal transduction histidine kinase
MASSEGGQATPSDSDQGPLQTTRPDPPIPMRDRTAGFRNLNLTQIAHEVVELFDPTAEENAVRLRLSGGNRVDVVGDRDLLFDAISNLVDNAIKHGGSKSGVTVAVSQSAGGSLLSVADAGPGIPVDERKHVLGRFYRLERSRNGPGNGLGLSLVAAVAKLHGARIAMADNSPGLKIELHFPLPEILNIAASVIEGTRASDS